MQTTGLLPVQTPVWQLLDCVQGLPSSHVVPFAAFVCAEHRPVDGAQVPATWQTVAGVQVTGLAPMQAPPWQVSVCVHLLPSSHGVPFAMFAGVEHVPSAGLHVLAILHAVAPAQLTGLLPVQTPPWHVSVCVHLLPSLHDVPFVTFACAEHWPLAGSHVLAALHAVAAGHVIGEPGAHAPA